VAWGNFSSLPWYYDEGLARAALAALNKVKAFTQEFSTVK